MKRILENFNYKEYIPKLITCLREGYSGRKFLDDLFAGLSIGIITLPLALAFAMGAGVSPERGLYTAIIAGFLIAMLGGSRYQIAGPTGAFIVIIYMIVEKHGYDGLVLATLIAGILLILMGLARFGILLKFIPYSVTTGFTTGIACVIFTSQLKDFFGYTYSEAPPQFIEKCKLYCAYAHTIDPSVTLISTATLILIFLLRHYFPKFPGAIVAIICATSLAYFFDLPLETIESKFGKLPQSLPEPSFPHITLERIRELFPEAITVALLGGIESLLSAVIADGMAGSRHRPNCELVAQGIGNIGSILFGGIPATGAIARTSANIRLGAQSPISGMIHAATVLLLMVACAPLAGMIPLCTLSAVLVYVAWNMSELKHFIHMFKGPKSDILVLLLTFLLTVLIDITVAVQVGVLLSAVLFMKKMTDSTTVQACKVLLEEDLQYVPENAGRILSNKDIPKDVAVFEIKGPFFYSVSDLLSEVMNRLDQKPRVFILRMRDVPMIDATGLHALQLFAERCKKQNTLFLISGANEKIRQLFHNTNLDQDITEEHIFPNVDAALRYASPALQT